MFQVPGSSPGFKPASCKRLPIPPSQNRMRFCNSCNISITKLLRVFIFLHCQANNDRCGFVYLPCLKLYEKANECRQTPTLAASYTCIVRILSAVRTVPLCADLASLHRTVSRQTAQSDDRCHRFGRCHEKAVRQRHTNPF